MSRIHEEDISAIKRSGFDECVDRVLEIMDKLYDTACDRYYKVGYVEVARNELRMCGQAVANLKGCE